MAGVSSSTPPDITEIIPYPISGRLTENLGIYTRSGAAFDIAIGGLPFLLAVDDQHPYQRQTAQWQKDQFDNSKEPGEQSLQQWWTRSQASFHKGEGVGFYEPGADELTADRYDHSVGVDVWTPGQATLTRSLSITTPATGDVWVESAVIGGVSGFYAVYGGDVHYTKDGSPEVAVTNSGDSAVSRPALCGSSVVVGTANGGLLKGTVGGSTIAAFASGLPTATGVTATPWWVKSRIIVAVGPSLYEVPLAGGTGLTPLYTHPDDQWTWTYVAESPQAILAAGLSPSGRSAIMEFGLTSPTDGSSPVLAQPVQVAEFPPGEQVYAIRVYLGTYVGIGTTRGLRVGLISADGTIQYGPLLARTDSPIECITGFDEFIIAGVTGSIDGLSGTVKVNLAESIDNLRFAWAWDTQTYTAGRVRSAAFVPTIRDGERQVDVVVGVTGEGVYHQSAQYVDSGYLLTGKVRYGTSEPKLFRLLDVDCDPGGGAIAVSTLDPTGAEVSLTVLDDTSGGGTDVRVDSLPRPVRFAQARFTLQASTDGTTAPVLRSWTLKSLPVVKRQRLIRYPMVLADFVSDARGVRTGSEGAAWVALAALEAAESASAVMLVQDFRTGETFPASIETVEFVGSDPPKRDDPAFRGVVSVTCRKL